MKVTRRKAEAIAEAYIALHNEASLEYKAAFARIGARMWHDDHCHLWRQSVSELAAAYMVPIRRGVDRAEWIRAVWGRMPYPLTVLGSWRHLKNFDRKRESLVEEVAKIHAKYQRKWHKVLRSLLSRTR